MKAIAESNNIDNLGTLLGVDRTPAERGDRGVAHFRDARRDSCEIPCDLTLVLGNGLNYDTGTAVLSNVSPTGALLTNIRLLRNSLPLALFTITLRLRGKQYEGIRIEATPVRFTDHGFSIGVHFDSLAVELDAVDE